MSLSSDVIATPFGPDGRAARRGGRVEWPTLLVAGLIYGGWFAITLLHNRFHPIALALAGGWLIAWHGSLQHEAIHGHPTPWRRLNDALAAVPLSLWLPYEIYQRSHLAHHASDHLTHPEHDPEARYLSVHAGALARAAAWLQSTLAGRLVFGPVIEVAAFLAGEAGRTARNEGDSRAVWLRHLAAVGLVWTWLHFACRFDLDAYLLTFVYPGGALTLLRSFAEHRASATPGARVAVVERAPLLGLLFLNNNLHAAHHRWPGAPWWRLPALYRRHRDELVAENGGLVYAGYAEVAARFLLRPHDVTTHPDASEAHG